MGDEIDAEVEGKTGWKSAPATRFELDGSKEGDVLVAFAKADGTTIDRDGHITEPGAFPTKTVPISSYGHSSWPEKGSRLPTGLVEIGEDRSSKEALAKGSFFVNTTHGRDEYLTVKALGPLQEWSYGYRVLAGAPSKENGRRITRLKSLDVFELSPVLIGAGIGTRTVDIKGFDDEGPLAGLPFADHLDRVLIEVDGIVSRSKSLRDLRAKDGRELSAANRARLERLRDSIRAIEETKAELEELLERTGTVEDPDAKALGSRLFLEFQQTIADLRVG